MYRIVRASERAFSTASRIAPVIFLICVSCATPQAIKDTSKTQLQLLSSINKATISLQQGLDAFHDEQANTIQDWARVEVATQTIESVVPKGSTKDITPDALFDLDEVSIQPIVDGVVTDFDKQKADLNSLKDKSLAPLVQDNLKVMSDRLQRARDGWTIAANNYCQACRVTRNQALAILQDENATSTAVDNQLELLRTQLQVMNQLASAVDVWLGIDVTLSQEQATKLDAAYKDAISKMETKK